MSVDERKPSAASLAEASAWLVRRQSGALDAEAQAQLRRWLAAAPENAIALDAALDAWSALDADPALARRTRRSAAGVVAGRAAAPLAAAACIVAAAGLWFGAIETGEYATGVGEARTVALKDGTTVRLDAMTRVRMRQTLLARNVELVAGRAVFSVAKQRRPFHVRTDQIQVTALGTRFTVSDGALRDQADLLQGRVEVLHRASGRKVELAPGESASGGVGGLLKSRTDSEADLAWTRGRIVLRGVRLAEAVTRFAPYAPGTVTFGDRWMESLQVSGSFRTADRTAFLRSVAELNGLVLEHPAPDVWRLARP